MEKLMENSNEKRESIGIEVNVREIGSKVSNIAEAIKKASDEDMLENPAEYNDLIDELSQNIRGKDIE